MAEGVAEDIDLALDEYVDPVRDAADLVHDFTVSVRGATKPSGRLFVGRSKSA
ncbi:hypothetical protein [Streptomyces sp. NBC_00083]|uniref:hypothetical protein n=1 Tax=Streptomyces sp. NBC_00083 TaxID=2975647 RepID=UPI002252D824|nr:hypothetical protein [Streptomyces sp. NBC_00083]MCX5387299.1 PIG-S family GPI transamidase component [Streptomyces sp. NBC_00083]